MVRLMTVLAAIVMTVVLQLNTYALDAGNAACRTECLKCAGICDTTMQHCRAMGKGHEACDHMKSLQDCASLCRQSARFIDRSSELSGKLCGLCAEACTKCAESCDAFKGDAAMKACAQQCRTCAQSCRKMSG